MTDNRLDRMRALAAGTALAVAAMGVVPVPALADDPEPEVSDQERLWHRLIAAELVGAIDGPLGVAGASIVISPITNFALEVGGGIGRDGARVAGGVRLMLPQDHFALMLRLGIAAGPEDWDGFAQVGTTNFTQRRHWEFQAGFYADVGLQYRFDMGLYLALNGGVETGFSSTADTCRVIDGGGAAVAPNCSVSGGGHPSRIYLALAVGYAFDIR